MKLGALVEVVFPHLWVGTTSVRQAGLVALAMVFSIQMVTPYGTDRGVVPLAPATHHHGSTYNYPLSQSMTLKSESVVIMGLLSVDDTPIQLLELYVK